MIVIQVGDQHCDTTAPRSRKDNYWESIQNKLLEIRNLANDAPEFHEERQAVFVGDLINRQEGHLVPYRLTNWLIDYFRGYKDMPIIILGNHDIRSRPDQWERQPIGAIIKAGVVRHLRMGDVYIREETWQGYTIKVAFTGCEYYYDLDKDRKGYNIPRVPDVDYHIHVVHGALLPEGQSTFGDFTTVDQIHFGGDLILCGHLHEDLGVFGPTNGKFRVSNFGAIARGSVATFNLNRTAQVGWIQVGKYKDGTVSSTIKPHLLKCAKPIEEVFYLEEIQKKKVRQEEMVKLAEAFMQQTESGFELIAPQQLLESWLTSKRVSPEAATLVREYVQRAEQELT